LFTQERHNAAYLGFRLTKQSKRLREYVAKIVHESRQPNKMKTIALSETVSILLAIVMLPIVASMEVLGKELGDKLMVADPS
jgi:hypothetical protein